MGLTSTRSVFTITAGRTGTSWLSEFLRENTGNPVVHEPLDIDDFGTNMPDIRTMRHFNTFGNNDVVKAFWERKLNSVAKNDIYIETNHTLAKCGLVENLARSDLRRNATLIVLRRDLVRQCVSYLMRNDFSNITIIWQWYLDPQYARRLTDPTPFAKLGQIGIALWYCYEMAARQTYYKRKFGGLLNIIDVKLDDITQPSGAHDLWHALGEQGPCSLPPPRNENRIAAPEALVDKVANLVEPIHFDVEDLVSTAMERGFSFEPQPQVTPEDTENRIAV